MKRKIAALLTFVMVLCTCMNAMAASYSVKWSQDANGNWQVLANGVAAKNAWIYDDECDTPGGIYYLVDENGKLVVAPLVLDGEGHYYSFSDQHDGHYGEMITKSGRYYGVDLVFDANHNGGFGSITNADGIAKLAAKYGVKEMPNIKNSSTVKLSEVNKASSDGGSQDYVASYKVSFNVNHNNATPSTYEAQTVKSGNKAVKPASPSDLNGVLTFKGWTQTMDGTDYFDFENTGVTSDMTLFARWGVDGYVVDYDGNGADNPEAEPEDDNIYKAGDFVTILSPGTLSREGFVFKEWNTQRDGSGRGYKAGETIMIYEDMQFYAIWDTKPAASYLTFTAEQAGSSVTINYKSGTDVKYSTDGGTNWTAAPSGTKVDLTNIGDTVCFKGKNVFFGGILVGASKENTEILGKPAVEHFEMTGKIKASGSATSMIDEVGVDANVVLPDECFATMFMDCTSLTAAPELPAVTLSEGCYAEMFYGCTALTKAPTLPAATLTKYGYTMMFSDCESLTEAPALPATTLAEACYDNMFSGCDALVKVPALPATTVAKTCYKGMFYGCASLTEAMASLPALVLADECYDSMFGECDALTKAPALPATTLAYRCYYQMFENCKALTTAQTSLPATVLAEECYASMFEDSGLTVAPTISAQTLAKSCCEDMFSHAKLTTAPVLPATTLAEDCYISMFSYCGELTAVPENMLPATTLTTGCYAAMFSHCSKLTNLPKLDATTLAYRCYNYMFTDCESLKIYTEDSPGRTSWKIPSGAVTATEWNANMFSGTTGSFTGSPAPGTTYYYGNASK